MIRREFEIGEGDAYNKALIDRAERRLNSLGYFKKVKITNEQGSAPDRVIVVVDVEDQPTGSLSVSGGYSTADGFIAEVAVSESNFMGRGQYVRLSVSEGQYARGVEFSFTEPYFLGNRLAAGFDIYAKQNSVSQYSYYSNFVTGGTVRFGLPITDEITFSPRYSLYNTNITIPNNSAHPYNDCHVSDLGDDAGLQWRCRLLWKQLLEQWRGVACAEGGAGNTLTSMFGYTLSYNTLDNGKSPTSGIFAELRQDIAGAGGNSQFVRTTGDLRYYHEIVDQVVGIVHVQGGEIFGFGHDGSGNLPIVDNFNLGPSLVRGFAPNGIGPRDTSTGYYGNQGNPLGGTTYFGGSLEVQFPIWGLPRDIGLKGALFTDAGSLFNYSGKTNFSSNGVCTPNNTDPLYTQGTCITLGGAAMTIRSSVGASLIWASPLGPIRFDFAKALTKSDSDQTQFFRFTGGTTF